jgi:hypothetical protein
MQRYFLYVFYLPIHYIIFIVMEDNYYSLIADIIYLKKINKSNKFNVKKRQIIERIKNELFDPVERDDLLGYILFFVSGKEYDEITVELVHVLNRILNDDAKKIAFGSLVGEKDEETTPLMLACDHGLENTAVALIRSGFSNPYYANSYGDAALKIAIKKNLYKVLDEFDKLRDEHDQQEMNSMVASFERLKRPHSHDSDSESDSEETNKRRRVGGTKKRNKKIRKNKKKKQTRKKSMQKRS